MIVGNVSSAYGTRTDVPGSTFHGAVDICAQRGTAVYAKADGIVIGVIKSSPENDPDAHYGNQVFIQRPDGTMDHYSHLDAIYVETMQKIPEGRMFATVGNTGYSTGPHLDNEKIVNGQRVDPVPSMGKRPGSVGLIDGVVEENGTLENASSNDSPGTNTVTGDLVGGSPTYDFSSGTHSSDYY